MSSQLEIPTVLSTQVAATVTKIEGPTKKEKKELKQVTYKSVEVVSNMDIKDNVRADMLVFLAKPSKVAPSEASSYKRLPKTTTTTGAIKKRKSTTLQAIKESEI